MLLAGLSIFMTAGQHSAKDSGKLPASDSGSSAVSLSDLAPHAAPPTLAPPPTTLLPSPTVDPNDLAASAAHPSSPSALPSPSPSLAPTSVPTLSPSAIEHQRLARERWIALTAPLVTHPVNLHPLADPSPIASAQDQSAVLEAGTIIDCRIYSSAVSTLAGQAIAFVTSDPGVFDATHYHLVLPYMAKLIGIYAGGGTVQHQNHFPMSFTQVQFGGHAYALDSEPGVDEAGTSGLGAGVNRHVAEGIKDFVILAATGALLNRGGNGCGSNCAQTYSSGGSAAGSVVQAGQQIFGQQRQEDPTLGVSEASDFKIELTHRVKMVPE